MYPQDGQNYQAKTPELPEPWDSGLTHTQTQCERGWDQHPGSENKQRDAGTGCSRHLWDNRGLTKATQ